MGTFKLLRDFNQHEAGETITVHDTLDNDMVRYGYGEKMVSESPKNKAIQTSPKNKAK